MHLQLADDILAEQVTQYVRFARMISFPKAGEIFDDRFELNSILGSGGLGTVFHATQLDTGRAVALKILHPCDDDDDSETQARFLREGRSLSGLQHDNIVTVYRMGVSESGLRYIAMELLSGTTLRSILNQELKLSVETSCSILAQCADALEAVHNLGLVHRDIKPENIMLIKDPDENRVKVIDFGFARKIVVSETQKLTATGVLVGTSSYMSPEQASGLAVDKRSDVYSVGVCLFEMISGSPPFTADNPVGVLYKHKHERIPKLRSTAANKFFAKALAKDPARRFQTMSEVKQGLISLSSAEGSGPLPKLAAMIAGVLILAMVISGALFSTGQNSNTKQNAVRVEATADSFERFKSLLNEAIALREKGEFTKAVPKIQEAKTLIPQLKPGAINEDYLSILTSECLYGSKQYEQCLQELRDLAAKPLIEADSKIRSSRLSGPLGSPQSSSPQDILEAKEVSAECLLRLNRIDEARDMIAPLKEWKPGLVQCLANAIRTFIELNDYDAVRTIMRNTHKPALLAVAKKTCIETGHPELSSLSKP